MSLLLRTQQTLLRTGVRTLRTLNKSKSSGIIDVEAQLAAYPPETRKQILEQIHELKPVDQSKQKTAEEYHAGLITDYLDSTDSVADLDTNFWTVVKTLSKSGIKSKSTAHTDLFGRLFESAKEIDSPELRQDMIHAIGQYIYRQKRIRFDPVNEVEYLDSLVAKSRPFQALKLWNSRVGREDVASSSSFWQEVGILYHLDAGLITKANDLALMSYSDKEPPLRIVMALINAWSFQLHRGKFREAASMNMDRWCGVLLNTPISPENIEVFENALHALIISREWVLCAQFLDLIPEENWNDPVKVAYLSQAFMTSALTKAPASQSHNPHNADSDFMPLFETILTNIPILAVDPVIGASLTLHFARSGDVAATAELLEDLGSRNVKIPPVFQTQIAKCLVSNNKTSEVDVTQLVTNPSSLLNVLKGLDNKLNASSLVARYLEKDGKLNKKLVCGILKMRLYNNLTEDQILKLGSVDPVCLHYLWTLSAQNKLRIPVKAIAQIETEILPPETLVAMCQAFVIHSSDFQTGVSDLFQTLSTFPLATPAQATLVLGTLKKLRSGYRFPLQPTKVTRINNQAEGSEVPWADVANQAAEFLEL